MAASPSSSIRGGFPLGLAGAVSATRYVGGTASVAPTTGTFKAGDFVVTLDGKVFVCTVAGTPGTWVQSGGSGGGGGELDYAQVTADAGVSGSSGAQNTIITGASVAYDGATAVFVQFSCYAAQSGSQIMVVELWEDAGTIGRIIIVQPNIANLPISGFMRRTPAAGNHTYSIRAWKNGGGDGLLQANAPGAPMFMRVTRAA